jgi:hypothetical protein
MNSAQRGSRAPLVHHRRHASPDELVRKALPIGNKRSFINLAAMPLHYLTGRELFVDLGENSLSDGLEDQLEVMRFWREATIAMRTDGVLYNMDADPPCDTGPYQLPGGSFLALRETCADGDGDFPWLDGIRETLPYHHFVLAYRLPGSVKMDNNVWGTAWFEAYHHSSWWPGL